MIRIIYRYIFIILLLYSSVLGQSIEQPITDSTQTDSLPGDSSQINLLAPDSADLIELPPVLPPPPPLPPPIRLIDSLIAYFGRDRKIFDVNQNDMYPRNGAGFLSDEASYFSMTRHETPLRTVLLPFGLPGGQINLQSGVNEIIVNDIVVPQDGRVDYDEIATADVVSATLLEGPLGGYGSPPSAGGGGLGMLYLEPMPIPTDQARSQFTLERGAYGYAYTRARIGRMFSGHTGFSFSSDFRTGEGVNFIADDDAYNIKTHLYKKIKRRSVVDLYINVYRRDGDFPVFVSGSSTNQRRLRREQQLIGSYSLLDLWGGQFTGRVSASSSRASYSSHSIKPKNNYIEFSYLKNRPGMIWELSAVGGTDKVDINLYSENITDYQSRQFGYVTLSMLTDLDRVNLFGMVRARGKEASDPAGDASVGISLRLLEKLKLMTSVGWHNRDPKLWESAPGLKREEQLTGNTTLIFDASETKISASVNFGRLSNAIYFDFRPGSQSWLESSPANDNIQFADFNLKADFKQIGPFYALLSGTYRVVESDRYGNRPPYSPRWQFFGRGGVRYFVNRYQVNLRLFGDLNYTEQPLSYRLEELNTSYMFSWGYNVSLKDLTFYYMMHNASNQIIEQPEFYGYTGWYHSWGINWKFLD